MSQVQPMMRQSAMSMSALVHRVEPSGGPAPSDAESGGPFHEETMYFGGQGYNDHGQVSSMQNVGNAPAHHLVSNGGFVHQGSTSNSSNIGGLVINNGLIMTQQPQQHQGQQAAFPHLPAPVSSASSLGSSASGSCGSSPMPTSNAALPQPTLAARLPQPQPTLSTGGLPQPQMAQPQALNRGPVLTFAPNLAANPTLAPVPAPGSGVQITTANTLLSLPSYQVAATGAASLLPASALAAATVGGSVPEFLYQLTKMLTDPNRDIIEWTTYSGSGRIEVHHPGRLEREVLGRYFRHSKYSSFQRQLNYFGFRKIAGKGKMSPCSYVNEAATADIRSLLLMKRKNSKEKEKELAEKRKREEEAAGVGDGAAGNKRGRNPGHDVQPATVQPMFASSAVSVASTGNGSMVSNSSEAFLAMAATVDQNIASSSAKASLGSHASNRQSKQPSDGRGYTVAVGKGLRHKFNGYLRSNNSNPTNNNNVASSTVAPSTTTSTSSSTKSTNGPSYLNHPPSRQAAAAPAPLQFLDPSELGMSIETSLSQLKDNFAAAAARRDSLNNGASSSSSTAPAMAAVAPPSSAADGAGPTKLAQESAADTKAAPGPSALTRRVSSMTFPSGGMLSRDDSLINLAMLPTLDGAGAASSSPNNGTGAADALSGIFSRNNSLLNLAAAAVETLDDGTTRAAAAGNGGEEAGGADAFGFIDFQP